MFDIDIECWLDADTFSLLNFLVKNCLSFEPDKNVKKFRLGNGWSFAKIKLNMSKAKDNFF